MEANKKPHNTADTSINAYRIVIQRGQVAREQQAVYEAIKKFQPITSRELSKRLGIERTNICRCIANLESLTPSVIKVAYKAKCIYTDIRVKHYSMVDWNYKIEHNKFIQEGE